MTRGHTKLGCAGIVIVVTIMLLAAHRQLLPCALLWLDVGEVPTEADAVFVLLGGEDVRPFAAAALYQTGFAKEILLSATPPPTNKYTRPMDEIFRDVMLQRGVPATAIHVIGDPVHNTMKESEALAEYLRANPSARVLVVTTHFHTRRTRWSLRHHLGSLADRLYFVSAPHDEFDATNWWLSPGGFELVLMEYLKLLGYWLRYGNAIWYGSALGLIAVGWYIWRQRRCLSARTVASPPDATGG